MRLHGLWCINDNPSGRFQNSKCKLATRRNFIAEGWAALHQAVLDSGGEVDYCPEDPEERWRSYVDSDGYGGLVAPLLKFSGIDPELLGSRSSTVKAAIWRWIRRAAVADAYPLWKRLIGLRSRAALMAAFADAMMGEPPPGAPKYSPRNPASVVRYGDWLIFNESFRSDVPIVPILWGLALIGCVWGAHLRCGYCNICFRRSRPGGDFCDSHGQRGVTDLDRSAAYMRYRQGRLAKELAETRGLTEKLRPHSIEKLISQRLVLPNVLFQRRPADGWDEERNWLVMALKSSPRVMQCIGGPRLSELPYEDLMGLLVECIDPYEWDYGAWPGKIFKAEIWFALEEEVARGKRGRGHKTNELVQEACHLATSGIRNGDIAARLSVAPSTVSRWLKRYPEFAKVCGLRGRAPLFLK